MSLSCPYRHVSYSAWRLNVFRSLLQLSDQPRCRINLPRHERTGRSASRRNYNSPSHFAESSHAPAGKDRPGHASPTVKKNKKQAAPREFNPYSPEGREAIKNLLTELRASSRKVYRDSDKEGTGTFYKSLELPRPWRRVGSDDSTPRESLQNEAAQERRATENLLEESDFVRWVDASAGQKLRRGRLYDSFASFQEQTPSLHESPVIRWLEKRLKQRAEEKVHPSYHHIRGLKNNPWAEALASPVRACQGSGARLPADLLLDFGYMKNPSDEKVYLMPANLAKLDLLDSKMAAELAASQQRTSSWIDLRAEQGDTGEAYDQPEGNREEGQAANSGLSKPRRPIQTQSRLLSNITFLEYLTNAITQVSKKRSRVPDTTVKRECIPGEVSKLIHFEGREAVIKAQHYLQNKRQYDAAVSGKPETTASSSADQTNKGGIDLKKLQWQLDVPSRIAHIMRRRILVALKALADAETAVNTQDVPGRPSGVIALPFPKKEMKGDELRTLRAPDRPLDNGLIRTVLSQQKQDEDEKFGDVPSPDDTTTAPETDDTSSPPLSESPKSQYQRLGHHEWLPGSIFLHIGTIPLSTLLPRPSPHSSFPPLPQNNPLIPPMLPVMQTYRFPVFSLHRLFSHPPTATTSSDLDDLRAILANPSFDRRESGRQHSSDYLLFVRSLQGPAKAVIKEVWRLWRYLGGENMDVSFFSAEEGSEGEGPANDRKTLEGDGPQRTERKRSERRFDPSKV